MVQDAKPKPPSAAPEKYVPGDRIADKYTLQRPLSEGGMGSLWVARNDLLHAEVVIKLVSSDAAPDAAARFLDEARAAARLDHPAIVRVFDVGVTRRRMPYIVMELLRGMDFGTALDKRGRLNAAKAIRTLLPIADALCSTHARGIVHRDIKPDNVFLAETEDRGLQPKLVDFGVAKLVDRGSPLTRAGSLLGTPGYMAPEQVFGKSVDHRVDIWALCVTLYEAMTGQLPFRGETYVDVLRAITEADPKPVTAWGAGDEALWKILARGLAKPRDERWPSMRALGSELASWLLGQGANDDICGNPLHATWVAERQRMSWHQVFSSPPPPPPAATEAPVPEMPTLAAPGVPRDLGPSSDPPVSAPPESLMDACASDPVPSLPNPQRTDEADVPSPIEIDAPREIERRRLRLTRPMLIAVGLGVVLLLMISIAVALKLR